MTRVGKFLMEQCAGTVKKLSLGLGGKAPFIVFHDADTCVCVNRILMQDGVYDAFTKRLAETAGG